MKKNLLASALIFAVFLSCNKNQNTTQPTVNTDTTAPTMILNGNTNDTISLNSTYVEAGVVAVDNVDGNISANVIVTGNINTNQTGDYVKKYNVKDVAGNSAPELSRNIHVRNDADFLTGNYAVSPNCGMTPASNYNTSVSVSSTVNRLFSFNTLQGNSTGVSATGTLGVGNTTFTLTALNGNNSSFGGSGNASSSGITGLTAVIQPPNGVGVYYCTSVFTKQ